MPNRSLDDFFGGDDEDDERDAAADDETGAGESGADEPAEPGDGSVKGTDDESEEPAAAVTDADGMEAETPDEEGDDTDEPTLTVEPATPTYDFSPDGAACESCGDTVRTRWHDEEQGMVCSDCKLW